MSLSVKSLGTIELTNRENTFLAGSGYALVPNSVNTGLPCVTIFLYASDSKKRDE